MPWNPLNKPSHAQYKAVVHKSDYVGASLKIVGANHCWMDLQYPSSDTSSPPLNKSPCQGARYHHQNKINNKNNKTFCKVGGKCCWNEKKKAQYGEWAGNAGHCCGQKVNIPISLSSLLHFGSFHVLCQYFTIPPESIWTPMDSTWLWTPVDSTQNVCLKRTIYGMHLGFGFGLG